MIRAKVAIVLFMLLFSLPTFAQNLNLRYDSTYVESSRDVMATRLFFSRKYTKLVAKVPETQERLTLVPNTGLKMGLGFTYQDLTINASFPVSFLYPDKIGDWPGNLDLQSHIYAPKVIVDFFGQFYNGYKIDAENRTYADEDYLREDLRQMSLGINLNYLFFGDKLSIAAAWNQSSIQKKSAYSPFIGFEGYGGNMHGDSLLLPSNPETDVINFDRASYFMAGPNAGMAGTLVFWKSFYLTGVASVNLSGGYTKWRNVEEYKKWGVAPTYYLRGFFGYNGPRFSITTSYVYKNLNLIETGPYDQAVNTGDYRINFIYKIYAGKSFKQKFNKVNPVRIVIKE
ncbi:DUF4421 domain-containing protein [Algoriphagus halophytocola]|uniref:DUF4421 domain-containing protein n=1 Tax=Algoriphagus halophytocola TaxID=2991499 RepID=UPI0022DD7EEC|nr:DUF4421 domain-containing protein [Algoriphagus sp. TR-M9]WBL43475.1 DUF4421 domain-containing protein [Algoriphagus sp. TR-M9]